MVTGLYEAGQGEEEGIKHCSATTEFVTLGEDLANIEKALFAVTLHSNSEERAMALAEQCAASFNAGSRSRGRAYFLQKRVLFDVSGTAEAQAMVRGSGGRYKVTLQWQAATPAIIAACTCPYYEGGELCKHIWATLLAADQNGWPPGGTSHRSIPVYHEDFESFDNDEALEVAGPQEPLVTYSAQRMAIDEAIRQIMSGQVLRRVQSRPKTPPGQWKGQLQQVTAMAQERERQMSAARTKQAPRNRRAWYIWNVAASIQAGRLVLDYYHQEQRKDGSFGKIKRQGIGTDDIPLFGDSADQRLLQLLLGNEARHDMYSYGGYSYGNYRRQGCLVAPVMYELILPELCATGRFVWLRDYNSPVEEVQPIAWDGGSPWHFHLQATANDGQKSWDLTGTLVRNGEVADLREPVLLLSDGLVLFPDRVSRLQAADDFGWIAALRQAGQVSVPYKERKSFLQFWWNMPHVPQGELPDTLQLPTEQLSPQGRFTVLPVRQGFRDPMPLYAAVAFLYADQQIPPDTVQAGIVDRDQDRVILRDHAAEEALIQQLLALGVRRNVGSYYEQGSYHFPSQKLPTIATALVEQGWIVEAEGVRIRPAGTFSLRVSSGVDWFDLEGQCDFDGMTISLPRLLQAVRNGERYVMLDDGSRGMLPSDWLAKYASFAELGEAKGDTVRFKPSQALLLDALLAEQQQVTVDHGFAAWRQKLKTFEGIKPVMQPSTFQGQLRPYQQEGLGWLHFLQDFHFGGCLADDMGLGKTVQVLALLGETRACQASAEPPHRPSLVVVPRSLVFNWIAEAERFTPQLRVLNHTGMGRAKDLAHLNNYDLVITTYGTLRRDIVHLKDVAFRYAILDEAQAIKNADAQTTKACRLLQAEHRLAMSGTPVENHLGELWSLFEFLNPGMLGQATAISSLSKSDADEAGLRLLSAGLRPFILRRTKAQVLPDLPEKTEQTVLCEMARPQRKLYDELRQYYRASLQSHIEEMGLQRAKIHVLEALLRLRQAACHPGLIDSKYMQDSSAKLEALLEQLSEVIAEGHKALVFSQFTSLLSIVRAHLERQGIVYEYLDGRTRNRQEKVTRFQTDLACPLFLISLKAGGHGLNLTAADYVFILDPWWNPAVEAQAVDRVHRIGQTRPVFAYRLICRDTVEEKILELQKHKQGLADAIISASNSMMRQLTVEDLQLLLS